MDTATDTRTAQAAMHADKPIVRKRPIIGRSQAMSASAKPLGVLFVSSKAPFMSVINRAIKLLDRGPGGARWSSTKVAPLLADRVAKAQDAIVDALPNSAATTSGAADFKAARQREVLLLATGHAISKLVLIAAWFRRQPGYVVTVRTRWASTIDDIFSFEGSGSGDGEKYDQNADEAMDVDGGEKPDGTGQRVLRKSTRVRNVSCFEVAVRLK